MTMMVVHKVIIPSFMDDGFDPSRTPVGFAVWFETAKAKTDEIEKNLTAFGGSALPPPPSSASRSKARRCHAAITWSPFVAVAHR